MTILKNINRQNEEEIEEEEYYRKNIMMSQVKFYETKVIMNFYTWTISRDYILQI